MHEASNGGVVWAEDGTGDGTQAVGLETEAATQCAGAARCEGEEHEVLQELGGGTGGMEWWSECG